jgi:hypothetical protein
LITIDIEFNRTGGILNQVNHLGDGTNYQGVTGSYSINYLGDDKIGSADRIFPKNVLSETTKKKQKVKRLKGRSLLQNFSSMY